MKKDGWGVTYSTLYRMTEGAGEGAGRVKGEAIGHRLRFYSL
ncbi:MAG: hypothetical protein WCK34_17820 [Bacteroidota bacterium]